MSFVKSLAELNKASLSTAGGKGANLGVLIAGGMPVPPGFVVTTEAYLAFTSDNNLADRIQQTLASSSLDDPQALASVSAEIYGLFQEGVIRPELAEQIGQAYRDLSIEKEAMAVAVRSSATAEDLPDLSFAGQQDTYLNIIGEREVLEAVRRCWGSLWTARAIAYRARNRIAQDQVALAVVVQEMVASEAAGVLFTANPLTGKRSETVIDAAYGLGEALVSGQVEPDHYVVESASGLITSKSLGAKAMVILARMGGGTVREELLAGSEQALADEQIEALNRLGQQAASIFGCPQDVEWALAEERFYVLQSRPITSLYPLPKNLREDEFEVLFSFGSWQGMLDPFTPLGRDIFSLLVVGLGRLFGFTLTLEKQRIFLTAGERLFVNFTRPVGSKPEVARAVLESVDPVTGEALQGLIKDKKLVGVKIGLRDGLRIGRVAAPVAGKVISKLLFPKRGRAQLQRTIDKGLLAIQNICREANSLSELAQAAEETMLALTRLLLPELLPAVVAGQIPLQLLLRRSSGVPGGPELALELTRGLPHNVTTEMDLELWKTSQVIREDPASTAHFAESSPEGLAAEWRAGKLPAAAQAALTQFLDVYGLRGVGEIDLGRRRWGEDPRPVMQVIQSYLQICDADLSPQVVFGRGAEKARQAECELRAGFRRRPAGWLKAGMVGWAAGRVRELAGLRETPKFAVIRMLGQLRLAFLDAGERLADQGILEGPEDLFFLHLDEIKALAAGERRDWKALIAERRAVYEREQLRRRIPRVILSDGTTFYGGAAAAEGGEEVLVGNPVSAGVVEGIVHVVHDPTHEQLAPGEILVCPATDPAWTPLFLAAGGLVMEIGGMITHGSVVAREYGIPAVVGVSEATIRLKTGQRVRVDGSSGQVVVLEGEGAGDDVRVAT